MAKAIAYTSLLATLLSAAFAQTFEVASVKLNKSGRNPGSTSRSGGQLVFENTSLRECIAIAYGISPDRDYALTGPSWIDTERYDIVAKVPAETPRPQEMCIRDSTYLGAYNWLKNEIGRPETSESCTLVQSSPVVLSTIAQPSSCLLYTSRCV